MRIDLTLEDARLIRDLVKSAMTTQSEDLIDRINDAIEDEIYAEEQRWDSWMDDAPPQYYPSTRAYNVIAQTCPTLEEFLETPVCEWFKRQGSGISSVLEIALLANGLGHRLRIGEDSWSWYGNSSQRRRLKSMCQA